MAEIKNGYAFKSSQYVDKGIRVIRISDVQKGRISDKDIKYYLLSSQTTIKNFLLRVNDLVMSLTGNVRRVAMLSQKELPAGLNQRVACIRPHKEINVRYLFHFLNGDQFEIDAISSSFGSAQKNMSTKWLAQYLIPLPSLRVQAEIVRILDTFSELEARLKQYAIYREQLLTFSENEVEWRRLGEVCEIERGVRITKKQLIANGAYSVVSGGIGYMGYYNEYNRDKNTITIAQYGTAGYVNWQTEKFWTNDVCLSVYPSKRVLKRYLYYFLSDKQKYLYSISNQEAIPHSISKDKILAIPIPIPPLSEQQRIVDILDQFEALTTALGKGLPHEIALRQKQYAYYRERLFTFP